MRSGSDPPMSNAQEMEGNYIIFIQVINQMTKDKIIIDTEKESYL